MWVLIVLSTWSSAVPAVMHDFSSRERCEEAGRAVVALGTYIYEALRLSRLERPQNLPSRRSASKVGRSIP